MEKLAAVKKIITEILEEDDLDITLETRAEDIEDWDSIVHIEIIVAIESHFNVKFTTLEIENFEKVGDIISNVESKTAG